MIYIKLKLNFNNILKNTYYIIMIISALHLI